MGKPVSSEWNDGFLFLGNDLALDFVNTRPVQNGEAMELLPDFEALVRWFRAAGLLTAGEAAKVQQLWGGSGRARRTAEGARGLRERLRKQIVAWESGAVIQRAMTDELNRLMAEYPMRTRLKTAGEGLVREPWFEAEQPEALLAPIADSAARLFAEVGRDRVRKCGECVLHFHDTSKKGTRRWCSMQLCGNRAKVAAYAARQRAR